MVYSRQARNFGTCCLLRNLRELSDQLDRIQKANTSICGSFLSLMVGNAHFKAIAKVG
ncbi:hypothetical protein [Thermoflavimicrobium daqui]|uniref:hypothetical protein n=1 Tax=Thermoflavimicrobium daqui TaxID=2137476 RepID=UPI00143D23EA|nr:hypothetical protein [Thermoflavimicrobium daqui]